MTVNVHESQEVVNDAPSDGRRSRARLAILVALLLALMLFGANLYRTERIYRGELAAMAHARAAEYLSELPDPDAMEYLASLDVSREYGVFGTPQASIIVFTREKDDRELASFSGIDHFYKRGEDGWTLTDSHACGAPEHHAMAAAAFGAIDAGRPREDVLAELLAGKGRTPAGHDHVHSDHEHAAAHSD